MRPPRLMVFGSEPTPMRMMVVFTAFAAVAALATLALPHLAHGIGVDMMLIYLTLAVLSGLLGILG